MKTSVLKLKVERNGKEYKRVHSLDVSWNTVCFTGEENSIEYGNYGPTGDVTLFVLIDKEWNKIDKKL